MERLGTVLRTSQHFSALACHFEEFNTDTLENSQLLINKTKRPGEEWGHQKSSRNFVSESDRFQVQIALYMAAMEKQSTKSALLGRRIWGHIRQPLLLPVPVFYC